eukprot:1581057-Rhodomonas_salina.1
MEREREREQRRQRQIDRQSERDRDKDKDREKKKTELEIDRERQQRERERERERESGRSLRQSKHAHPSAHAHATRGTASTTLPFTLPCSKSACARPASSSAYSLSTLGLTAPDASIGHTCCMRTCHDAHVSDTGAVCTGKGGGVKACCRVLCVRERGEVPGVVRGGSRVVTWPL